jgi:hypothetical protein
MSSVELRLRCREIGSADVDRIVDLLTRGFRVRAREFWVHALKASQRCRRSASTSTSVCIRSRAAARRRPAASVAGRHYLTQREGGRVVAVAATPAAATREIVGLRIAFRSRDYRLRGELFWARFPKSLARAACTGSSW